jgi:hypothetical protein
MRFSLSNDDSSGWLSRGLWAVAVAFLSLGGLLTLDETPPGDLPQLSSAVASVDAGSVESGAGLGAGAENSAGSVEYLSKPIRELRTMRDRVLAHNPQRDETQAPLTDIDPQQWRVVTLQHDQPDGSRVTVERGVPLDSITAEGLSVGRTLDAYIPEFDVQGEFTVASISACPTPASGPGQLVTSRFIHENAEVWDLTLEGSPEPLGTTSSHPFWSVDRESFIPASDLQPGERLQLADGTTRAVQTLTKRRGRTTVYNIEVDAEHVFYVGQDGVLVHNNCGPDDLVTVFHYTDAKGLKAITAGKDITIKSFKPRGGNPVGAYFSKIGPDGLRNKAASKLNISRLNTQYVIEAKVPRRALRDKNGFHDKITFSPEDVHVPQGLWTWYENPFFK